MKVLVWKIFVSVAACLVSLSFYAAEPDRVLLHIQGEGVTKGEFEHYCRSHMPKDRFTNSVDKCMEDFIRFKLKVFAAKSCGWDTLPTFRQQCKVRQGEVLKSYFIDNRKMEDRCRDLFHSSASRLVMNDWVQFDQITVPLSQHASKKEEYAAKVYMDSVYKVLQQGGGSGLKFRKSGGWLPLVGLLQEFVDELVVLPKGGYSAPFFSPMGMHIIRLVDRKQGLSYEEARPYLEAYLEQHDISSFLKKKYYDGWVEGRSVTGDVAVALREVKDRFLVECWDAVHRPDTESLVGKDGVLAGYFEKHKDAYRWEFPHYKGAVIRCSDKKAAKKIKKLLKKSPMSDWKEALDTYLKDNPSLKADMQVGLFQIGTNAYVDKLAFKCGELPSDSVYHYAFLVGKRLKKGPEVFKDVYDDVLKDYQEEQYRTEFEDLRKRFPVEINQEVLKTVNCGGSN